MSFIVIEGADGSGKGTQTKKLIERLEAEGQKVKTLSFPQYGTPGAAMVEEYLHGNLGSSEEVGAYRASILFAVDRYAAKKDIEQWLAEGYTVVADRYVGSNMAHQGGKMKDVTKRNEYFAWNHQLEYTIFDIPKPDINIILHMSAETSFKLIAEKQEREYLKGKVRDMHEGDIDHLRQAEKTYLALVEQFPEFTVLSCEENGTLLSIDAIHEILYQRIQPFLNKTA